MIYNSPCGLKFDGDLNECCRNNCPTIQTKGYTIEQADEFIDMCWEFFKKRGMIDDMYKKEEGGE